MHPKMDMVWKWELDTIEYYFEKGLSFFINEIEAADDTMMLPGLSQKSLAIGSFDFFRQSVFYELNALVEHYFQIAAAGNESLLSSNKHLKRGRSEAVKTIMQQYNIQVRDIIGFAEVKQLYSTVNALKHRGGFECIDFSCIVPELRRADTEIETLKQLKDATFQFVTTLVNTILLIERNDRT